MESAENLVGLRGLFQDLSALPDPSFGNIDRLRVELEAHIHDFRDLLDKPTKNNGSRQTVLSGRNLQKPFTFKL
jgi:nuclear pore complex protein Nup205